MVDKEVKVATPPVSWPAEMELTLSVEKVAIPAVTCPVESVFVFSVEKVAEPPTRFPVLRAFVLIVPTSKVGTFIRPVEIVFVLKELKDPFVPTTVVAVRVPVVRVV